MTKEEIIRLINKGENQQVEFKKAKDTLPNSIWETKNFIKPDLSESFNPERISFVLQWHHTGQGSEKTAGSSEETKKSSEKTAGSSEEIKKSSEKTGDKIVRHIKDKPYITIAELAQLIGISTRAIEKQLEKLKIARQIRRKGPDKGGYWEVME